jgi:predicted MPP superfamily phosphohydrolase
MNKKPLNIAHLADIHIFFDKRHDEHIEVINNLKESLIKDKLDLIYVAGDVTDSKTRISPEQLDVINYFFYTLSDIAPVICIIGNHDTNLYTQNKLDALTPIINELKTEHPIYLLKNTGVYNLYNIDWLVWSRTDDKNPLDVYTFSDDRYTIGCYHGPIEGCVTDTGWNKFSKTRKLKDFGDCQTVFLGDIHKLQYFKKKIEKIVTEEQLENFKGLDDFEIIEEIEC